MRIRQGTNWFGMGRNAHDMCARYNSTNPHHHSSAPHAAAKISKWIPLDPSVQP
jgi:hypothetical protein